MQGKELGREYTYAEIIALPVGTEVWYQDSSGEISEAEIFEAQNAGNGTNDKVGKLRFRGDYGTGVANIWKDNVHTNVFKKTVDKKIKAYIEERVLEIAKYLIDTKKSIGSAAKVFGVSESTVKRDIENLPKLNPEMALELEKTLGGNKK